MIGYSTRDQTCRCTSLKSQAWETKLDENSHCDNRGMSILGKQPESPDSRRAARIAVLEVAILDRGRHGERCPGEYGGTGDIPSCCTCQSCQQMTSVGPWRITRRWKCMISDCSALFSSTTRRRNTGNWGRALPRQNFNSDVTDF